MVEGHRFHPTILREYDIRGIVGQTLTVADAGAIGRAFGTMLGQAGGQRVCVGRDGRLSSPELEAALVEGLASTGLTVERIGRGPTPMLYFAVKHRGADGGLMITGSHNPAEYNGVKMVTAAGSFYGDRIQELGRIAATGAYRTGAGKALDVALYDDYVARLLRGTGGYRPLTIAWDAGNGATGAVLRAVTAGLPGRHILLFDEIDGRFPNHHPDPTVPANLVDLQRAVAEQGCDLGVAFDGDGDRIGAIDEQGRIIWGDQLLALYASEILQDRPGATIIADVKSSQTLFDEIARMGGTPLMWKTGHSLLKAKMAETGSPLAGEMSGHIFFADQWYGFDDALYCAIRLFGLVSRAGVPLSALRDRLPTVLNTPEIRFQVSEERKFVVIEEVSQRLAAAGAEVTAIDGVRVRTADGWWLLRASNTQDVLVARCESTTAAGLERLKAQLADQVRASGIDPAVLAAEGH